MDGGDHFRNFGEMHGGGNGLGWVIFVLVLLLVLLVFAQLAMSLTRRPRFGGPMHLHGGMQGPPGDRQWGPHDALEVARMRYARGEIDRDAYVQLAQDLGGDAGPPPPSA